MPFERYQSRPITRLAHELTEEDEVRDVGGNTYVVLVDGQDVVFKAYQEPLPGDFVVYLNNEDIYHCAREVFLERNIVDEGEAA